ncbi:hypothetical protein ACFL52_04150 [Candidatus Margulisiibacteriota bacterium]
MMKKLVIFFAVLLTLVSTVFAATQLSAKEIIQKVIARYEQQMNKVNDITTITDKYALYQKKAINNGRCFYKSRMEIGKGRKKYISIYDGSYVWTKGLDGKVSKTKIAYDPYRVWKNFADVPLIYNGKEKIDGSACYVLEVNDMNQVFNSDEFESLNCGKINGKIWIDTNQWLLRKIEMSKKVRAKDGNTINKRQVQKMEDFRPVAGILIPHRETVSILSGSEVVLSQEKRKLSIARLKAMQDQINSTPKSKKRGAVKQLKPQIDAIKAVLDRNCVTVVNSVKINCGLVDSLFDGKRL